MVDKLQNSFMSGFEAANARFKEDKADLVQTIIITAVLAVAAILAMSMLSSALINKGEAVAGCIAGSSNFSSGATAKNNCETLDNTAKEQSKTAISENGGGQIFK